MIISVTEEHIRRGGPQCSNCPIALALIDALDLKYGEAFVVFSYFRVKDQKYYTNDIMRSFINNFDQNGVPFPFTFNLEKLKKC